MRNLFKNIYLNNILIIVFILIILFIIYYLNFKTYDNFNDDIGVINAKTYLENSDETKKFAFAKPDLGKTGPIKFVDANDTNIILGKYPNNWTEKEVLDKGLTITVIKIPRGPTGNKGDKGDSAVFDIKDTVSLEQINSDNLKINAKELNLNAKKINLNNSICFGDNDTYCIDKNFINYLNDTNNLIEEKKAKDNLIDTKTKQLNKCNSDLKSIQDDIETNYFSKHIDVPGLYIETKKCNEDKEKILTQYDTVSENNELQKNFDKLIKQKDNLVVLLSSRDKIIADKVKKLKQCTDEKKSNDSDMLTVRTDSAKDKDTVYDLRQKLTSCQKNKNDIDLDNYMPITEHETILSNDYISKKYVEDNYTNNSDIDTRFKDIYGNYLTTNYVNNNYYKKDIKDAEFDIKCQKKIEDALSDDPIRSDTYKNTTPIDVKLTQLEQLYNNKLETNKTNLDSCIVDKNTNYYKIDHVINNYKDNEHINNNYMLKTDCDNRINNDYIASSIIDKDYIKNDDVFKMNYVSMNQYNTLNTSLDNCNIEKNDTKKTNDDLEERIKILGTTLNNMDCTDCTEYTKGAKELLNICQAEKNTALQNELELKGDIKKLGNFITQLHNNITNKEDKIANVVNNLANKTEAHDSDVKSLTDQIEETNKNLDDKDISISELTKQNEELNKTRDDAVKVIHKLQKDIKDSATKIEFTQAELNSKLLKLQDAAKQIDKCKKLEKEANDNIDIITELRAELAEWDFKAHGSSAASKEINELDYKLQKALYEKDVHGKNEYVRGKKIGRDNTKKIYKYSLYDLQREWEDGWDKGKNLSTLGKEEKFLQEKCNNEFKKGVASRQEYVYTDEDMKREIEKTEKDIGTRRCEPKECVNIT